MSNEFRSDDAYQQPKRKKAPKSYHYEEEKGMSINVGGVGRVKKRSGNEPKVNLFSGFDHGFGKFGAE